MIPKHEDFRILFEGKPEEFLKLYKEEIEEIMSPDEDDEDPEDIEDYASIEEASAEEIFELLFTIPTIPDDDYCELINVLADEYLPCDVDADYEDDKIVVYIDENRHVIDSKDGRSVIRKFDEIIRPDFETRVMNPDTGEDSLYPLIILKSDDWKYVEDRYGTKVAEYFEKLT
ncbi:MAG: hypothetical protein LBQ01_06370 [Prevotellaceae bacterium]|jgi:hypothetical protein|nr:hypothetical protein [Prevotellaceae bacterium]